MDINSFHDALCITGIIVCAAFIAFLVALANHLTQWDWQQKEIAKARAELDARSRCRCTKCGEWTQIRRVHNREVASIKGDASQTKTNSKE